MERLTFDGNFCDISQCREMPGPHGGSCTQRKVWERLKRKWENGFQRWSDRHSADGGSSFGCCGFGSMCDYCDDNTYGRPCVRALNAMIREKRLKIDYEKTSYVEAWEGILGNG